MSTKVTKVEIGSKAEEKEEIITDLLGRDVPSSEMAVEKVEKNVEAIKAVAETEEVATSHIKEEKKEVTAKKEVRKSRAFIS